MLPICFNFDFKLKKIPSARGRSAAPSTACCVSLLAAGTGIATVVCRFSNIFRYTSTNFTNATQLYYYL